MLNSALSVSKIDSETFESLIEWLELVKLQSRELTPDDFLVINKAFVSLSAQVRAKCIDLLAFKGSPKMRLSGGLVGDLILWHVNDGDPRVRERAYYCLLTWLTVQSKQQVEVQQPIQNVAFVQQDNLCPQRQNWIRSNLELVYQATCRGLLDPEMMVRRSSVLLLVRLSTLWPLVNLIDPPAMIGFPISQIPPNLSSSTKCVVSDAFARLCLRLQDPAQQVRQLAAQALSQLAKHVTDDHLVKTLEKTIMSDGKVRRTMPTRGSTTKPDSFHTPDLPTNILSAGSSGAIISGLEDDYFEIRCATLSTVNVLATISTSFAANSQDLLVDMLTDDIQEVRLAAVTALGAVGDKVPLQSNQVAIITSAMAEGSGRIRRRLHQLLSRCRLASPPCLINLLEGLLQNLQRYPQDRESIWRCAASVGLRHPAFVEACLPCLLRTHSYLSAQEPNREDPNYLTVLLLVLNAEPGAPGMPTKFPRHVSVTKSYLRELVPHLLPKPTLDVIEPAGPMFHLHKHPRLDPTQSTNWNDTTILHAFLIKTINQIAQLLWRICDDNTIIQPDSSGMDTAPSAVGPCSILGKRKRPTIISDQYTLLSHLVSNDLQNTVRRLDRSGRLTNLMQWYGLLSTIACNLVFALMKEKACVHDSALSVLDPESCDRRFKLLIKVLRSTLKGRHLFTGKTPDEDRRLTELSVTILKLIQSSSHSDFVSSILSCLKIIHSLLLGSAGSNVVDASSMKSVSRISPVHVHLLQPSSTGTGLMSQSNEEKANNLSAEESEESKWVLPISRSIKSTTGVTTAIPEVQFTATLATASIRIRALVFGLNLSAARSRICVLFSRPDQLPVSVVGNSKAIKASQFYEWWPPHGSWHLLDETLLSGFVSDEKRLSDFTDDIHDGSTALELRTHLELTAGRWSNAGTVELGLGYCVNSPELVGTAIEHSIILPLTPRNLFAKIRLVPRSPAGTC